MIIVTGAAGFIGSCLVRKLNNEGFTHLVLADDFSDELKNKNLEGKQFIEKVHRKELMSWTEKNHQLVDFIFHIGARTDTTEFDTAIFDELNLNYSKNLWEKCVKFQIPFIYASSAATYGMGEFGFEDNHEIVEKLKPLNPYGQSKNEFDKRVLRQIECPPFWAGFKFFNVFGPNQVSQFVISKFIHNAKQNKPIVINGDGKQQRAYCYVDDAVRGILMALQSEKANAEVINIGNSSNLISINDLARMICRIINVDAAIITNDLKFENTDRKREREIFKRYPDTNKAKLLLGFEAEVGLEEALKKVVKNANYIKSWPKKRT